MSELKNKKELIFVIFITGILLLLVGRTNAPAPQKEEPVREEQSLPDIERRLENALSAAEGVGEVRVVIYYKDGGQKIIAKDKTEESDENKKHFEEKVVLTDENKPIVLRENTCEIEGVLIIARGGGDPKTRAMLISAAQALLGIETHKIEVLKMK